MKRRAFVLGSIAVTGGLAIGYVYRGYRRLPPRLPTSIPLAPGQVSITPYVVIDQSGLSLIAPRAEMGQGIRTTLAALVAEELGVTLSEVHVLHGPASELYSNWEGFGPPRYEGRTHGFPTQFTGGQTSTRDAFMKMRRAGAAARTVLVEAAAQVFDVPASDLRIGGASVIAPDGRSIPYVDLATAAAELTLAEKPMLRARKDWRILGKPQARVDMVEKCTGTAVFGMDVLHPDLLYATAIRNPASAGPLLDFDPSRALTMRGVKKVIPIENGVIVIATNTWYAFEAAKAVECKWGPAPYPTTTRDHFAVLEQAFKEPPLYTALDKGSVDKALSESKVVNAEYRVPYLAHATMEPMNATAQFNNGDLTIWSGTQMPTKTVATGAQAAGIEEARVTLNTTYLGGGFGRRLEQDVIELAVKAALHTDGRPVKLLLSREEDTRHDAYRPLAIARFQGCLSEGKPLALDFHVSVPSLKNPKYGYDGQVEVSSLKPDKFMTIGLREQPYKIPNYRVSAYLPKQLLKVGFFRGVAESQNTFFHESAMDEMCHEGGLDPLEARLSLLDHRPGRTVLETVGEMSNWGSALPDGHGRGLAFAISSGAATAQVIEVAAGARGIEVLKAFIVADVGIALDPRNIHGQLEGAFIFGFTAAKQGEVTISKGAVEQSNFHDYPVLRMHEIPKIITRFIENGQEIFGVGEAAVPTVAPALGNAIYAANGQRIRELPFNKSVRFA